MQYTCISYVGYKIGAVSNDWEVIMRIFKHAFLNLIRKPSKAVMILLIMVLVFSLVFTGIIITNSIGQSREFIRISLGAVVRFEPDWMKAMADQIDEAEYEKMQMDYSTAMDIGSDSRVKKTYLIENTYLNAPGLKSGIPGNDGPILYKESIDIIEPYEPYEDYGPGMNISGSNNPVPIEFETGRLTLSAGRHITQEELDRGDRVILISEEFAAVNNLSPGDTMSMKSWEMEVPLEYTIVGIYQGAEEFAADNVYTTSNVIQEINSFYDYPMETYYNVYFVLNNPLEIEGFISDSTEKLPSKYTKLTANEDDYKQLTKPLDLMEIITNILVWVVFAAGAMIIISVVTIFIRDRKFEIGLLLSAGESKLRIAAQFVFEIALVAILSFALAAGASQLTSKYVSNWIVDNQLVEEKTESENPDDYWMYYDDGSMKGDVDINDVAGEFDISIDFNTLLTLFGISMGILLFAAGTPLVIILRYKPREALQES